MVSVHNFRSRTFVTIVSAMLMAVGVASGVSADPQNTWDADGCTVVVDDTGQVTVRWTPGTSAANHDVWRNGHRIAMTGSSIFRDVYPPEGVVHYSVAGRSGSSVQQPREYCGKVELDGTPTTPPPAPASCLVEEHDGFVVSWDHLDAAHSYVVSRSVNGSRFYWRGRTSETIFEDSARSGDITYQVASRSASGLRSVSVECSKAGEPPINDCRTQITLQQASDLALPSAPVVDQSILDQLPPSVDSAFVADDGWIYYVAPDGPDLDHLERVDLDRGITERIYELGVQFRTYEIQLVDAAGATYVKYSDKTNSYFNRYGLDGERADLGDVDSVGFGTYTQPFANLDDGRSLLVTVADGAMTSVELYDPIRQQATTLPYATDSRDFPFGSTADGNLVGSSDSLSGFRFDLDCAAAL